MTHADKARQEAEHNCEREKLKTGREHMLVKHGNVLIVMPDTWAIRECLNRVGGREIVYETRGNTGPGRP